MRTLDDKALMRIAHIIGPQSAAAKALTELLKRREAGENVVAFMDGEFIVVGPPLISQGPRGKRLSIRPVNA